MPPGSVLASVQIAAYPLFMLQRVPATVCTALPRLEEGLGAVVVSRLPQCLPLARLDDDAASQSVTFCMRSFRRQLL